MNKFVAPFAALAFMLSAAVAYADEASGKVAAVDPASSSLILEDGTTFTIGEGVSMEGLEPGTEVTVSYEEQDGQLVATEVAPSN
jgi:Cu/Ag efflux protein CusF